MYILIIFSIISQKSVQRFFWFFKEQLYVISALKILPDVNSFFLKK